MTLVPKYFYFWDLTWHIKNEPYSNASGALRYIFIKFCHWCDTNLIVIWITSLGMSVLNYRYRQRKLTISITFKLNIYLVSVFTSKFENLDDCITKHVNLSWSKLSDVTPLSGIINRETKNKHVQFWPNIF